MAIEPTTPVVHTDRVDKDNLRERIARALAEAEDPASDWHKISDAHFADRFWRGADAVLNVLGEANTPMPEDVFPQEEPSGGWPDDPYDEDGYCDFCGNGRWKLHAPWCKWADAKEALALAHQRDNYRDALTIIAGWQGSEEEGRWDSLSGDGIWYDGFDIERYVVDDVDEEG